MALTLIGDLKEYIKRSFFSSWNEIDAAKAYDLWAENYDHQSGNLMLDLDKEIFSNLFNAVDVKSKTILDIGCGTGRHWLAISDRSPAQLTGCDVSAGMLEKLNQKFPWASTTQITDNSLPFFEDKSYDLIISTLTVAHIEDIRQTLKTWSRILKDNCDLIITDFHPAALAYGGKRTFQHDQSSIAIKNHIHSVTSIKGILLDFGFELISKEERCVDDSVRHYYEKQNAFHVYEQFRGIPIIYGLHLRRGYGTE